MLTNIILNNHKQIKNNNLNIALSYKAESNFYYIYALYKLNFKPRRKTSVRTDGVPVDLEKDTTKIQTRCFIASANLPH
jgi:hypothetical protein